jgi:hypothetical protein
MRVEMKMEMDSGTKGGDWPLIRFRRPRTWRVGSLMEVDGLLDGST